MSHFDLIIIGSGPGGYVAAVRATQLGLSTAIVEKEPVLGGVCLNWGCIPTKALLTSSGLLTRLGAPAALGLVGDLKGDYPAIHKRSREAVKKLNSGVAFLMKSHKVQVFTGTGQVTAPGKVTVTSEKGTEDLSSKHILLATGGRGRDLPGVSFDGQTVLSARDILSLEALPESLAVVGGGAIGVEFADFFATLGTKVTLIEFKDRLLPQEDTEVSEHLTGVFKKRGINILTGSSVQSVTLQKNGLAAIDVIGSGGNHTPLIAQKVLLGVGVRPNTEGLFAEGVEPATTPQGFLKVNEHFETSVPGIYAIGDVNGPPLLAHAASQEGRAAVGYMAGREEPWPDPANCPGCVYTHPEAASVGQTEDALKEQGTPYKTGKVPFTANGRAIAAGEAEGFVKVLVDPEYGSLLGAHLIGPNVSELIAPLVIMKTAELSVTDMLAVTFPHPTLSEAVYHALSSAVGLRTD